jgi:hypothetical protein
MKREYTTGLCVAAALMIAGCAGTTRNATPPRRADVAQSAQQVADRLGCPRLLTVLSESYLAACANYSVAIECPQGACRPTLSYGSSSVTRPQGSARNDY